MKPSKLSFIRKQSLVVYFILAYGVTWSFEIPLALSAQGLVKVEIPLTIHYMGAFGPMIAALVLTVLTKGAVGIHDLISRWFKWRVQARYYAFAILGPIARWNERQIKTVTHRIQSSGDSRSMCWLRVHPDDQVTSDGYDLVLSVVQGPFPPS